MGSMSVRGIDEELSRLVKQKAEQEKKSLNQYVLDLLKRDTGLSKEKRFTAKHHDLDHLLGCWEQDEHDAVAKKISEERRIDPELWK